MSGYFDSNFLCNSYSEEISPVTEIEYDEVMRLIAEEDKEWQAYSGWASQLEETERVAALEQYAFERKQERLGSTVVNGTRLLTNRECECCDSSHCKQAIMIEGIAI
jgi:hypothetical protein